MGVVSTIDISPQQKEELLALLNHFLPHTTAWAYGSRVTWNNRYSSDLDVVVFAGAKQRGQVEYLREALEESGLPFRVDLFVWDSVPDQFKPSIETAYYVLQENTEALLPDGWRQVTLGEVANISTGKADSQDATFDCKAVIVPGEGRSFAPRYCSGKFDLHQRAYKVTSHSEKNTLTHFIYYCLLDNHRYLAQVAVGSTVKSLRLNSFTEFPITVPPLRTQKAITHVLGTIDDKIELNQKMNQTIEEIAKAIYASPKVCKVKKPPSQLMTSFSKLRMLLEHRRENIFLENKTLSELRDTLLPKLISDEVKIADIRLYLYEMVA